MSRSFSGCSHACVVISKIIHMISSQVTCFFLSPRFAVLNADFHSGITGNRSHFCNIFFVMENFCSFESDCNFLLDLFQNCNWLENRRLIEKLKVFSNLLSIDKLSRSLDFPISKSINELKLKNRWQYCYRFTEMLEWK